VRQSLPRPVRLPALALAPYLLVQWLTLALVVALPQLVWHRNPMELPAVPGGGDAGDAGRDAFIDQLRQQEAEQPSEPSPALSR